MNYMDTKMQLLSGICRVHRTQHLVVPISRIYYSKRIQSKISQGGKAHGAKSRGYQVQASKSLLPVESCRTCLIPPATMMTTFVNCCLLGKLLRDSVPTVFIGGLSCKHSI